MSAFECLFVGHLLGDFLLQNDWQAASKRRDSKVCAVHAGFYFLGLLAVGLLVLPWWAYPLVVLPHFIVDRLGLARKYMSVVGQEAFATGNFAPWSVVVVDQCMHLVMMAPVAFMASAHPATLADLHLFLQFAMVMFLAAIAFTLIRWRWETSPATDPGTTAIAAKLLADIPWSVGDAAQDEKVMGAGSQMIPEGEPPFDGFSFELLCNMPQQRKAWRVIAKHLDSEYITSADADTREEGLAKVQKLICEDFPAVATFAAYQAEMQKSGGCETASADSKRLTNLGWVVDLDPTYKGRPRVLVPFCRGDEWHDIVDRVKTMIPDDPGLTTYILSGLHGAFVEAKAGIYTRLARQVEAVDLDKIGPLEPLPALSPPPPPA